jgi:starch synthase (maltosyl-transferring)
VLERAYRLNYLFAASFSTGVMMPMGYEFGFAKPLHVVESRPGDWQWEAARPKLDLVEFIGSVNRMKAAVPALNVEGMMRRVTSPQARLVGLMRFDSGDSRTAGSAAVVLVNPDEGQEHGIDPSSILAESGGRVDGFEDVTPGAGAQVFEPGSTVTLQPLELRVFQARALPPARVAATASTAKEARRRMDVLAENRIAIEAVYPELDGGRHAVKRTIGDVIDIQADIFADGHEKIAAAVKYRLVGDARWREAPMRFVDNDRWQGRIAPNRIGRWQFVIEAWRDLYATWRDEVAKKRDAGLNIALELIEGRQLVDRAAEAAGAGDKPRFQTFQRQLDAAGSQDEGATISVLMSDELSHLMAEAGPRTNLSRYKTLEIIVDRTAARFSAWYELFPRSQSGDPNRHGTFRDVIARLPYVRDLGFDVLYFTPIHPVGKKNRKGRNNSLVAQEGDPGSPYAIGSDEGGHDALHPELGTFEDFKALVDAAHDHGLEIAMDFAIQCAPDHPWLKQHPEWFDWRPDGTIKYAENPPKKYEDIVPVHFYREAYPEIWFTLRDVILFWCGKGVRIFRVDNPHTKPLPFWEWMIQEVQDQYPDAIFLAEAFTKPKMMKRLGKIGFTQSYTYFTWRNKKQEIIEYLTELAHEEPREYYRPNFFANTPDINPYYLQSGKRAAFMVRGLLAATLSSVYGLYNGFELCEGTPVPGKEDYLNSEKYELKAWDYDRPGNIRDFITKVNRIRRDNPALHDWRNIRFYNAWNDNILVYGKMTPNKDNFLLFAVNLDQDNAQGCAFEAPLWEFNLPDNGRLEVEELLTGSRFIWDGKIQHIWLDPAGSPCAVWRIKPPGL